MNKYQALDNFWNSFLDAYDVSSVPDKTELPYMTYEVATDSFGEEVAITNSLWYNATDWVDISLKTDEIAEALGLGGSMVRYDGGGMWIKKGTPFSQRVPTDNETIERVVLNFSIEFISE